LLPLASIADDGVTYGTRHQYSGGGSNELCLKNSAGDQGGVRQGGQDSNDMIVPLRQGHSNYNGLPSRNNILRAKESWIIPCAKCKYAKSCFMEAGVAECPTGYHKMYTGYMFAGHQGHSGNNDRICVDKNPADTDCEVYPACDVNRLCLQSLLRLSPRGFTTRVPAVVADVSSDPGTTCFSPALLCSRSSADTSSNWYDGVIYPTVARDGRGTGLLRNNRVVPACHMCCVR